MQERVNAYFEVLSTLQTATEATDFSGHVLSLGAAFDRAIGIARSATAAGGKLMIVGNGGSAGIASHLAIDFSKNGGMSAMAFNDPAALTCLGNDLGYENVFAAQIGFHARPGDLLVAISSSGRSPNILKAVAAARERDCGILTLSGFDAGNPLRRAGDVNLYVPSTSYGFVEVSHLALCHALLDLAMGWTPKDGPAGPGAAG
ncbi:D-sedoheptulose 7-phosphate isomerase [Azospirillum lipoferum]|uniref:D-sedoheptulose-7-phosphate isomerase n=1 Tax=Azospirillum TaxID=191 RepID=UPI001B3C0E63|nr:MULTISPECIES: SIS domain-containing protein [Azospirillum]MCP1614206.1 D-sedoheptulose 7-phosphate isomerase [Azospirillum lipoferum]MDW5536891.1 SIS domain-containing protein [Azospirillum sp. NL1]